MLKKINLKSLNYKMYFPLYYTPNFFDNPDEIKQWAESLEFTKPEDGRYPGARTEPLHMIDKNFYDYVHLKIMSLVYGREIKEINWTTTSFFQLIKYEDVKEDDTGWIHIDEKSMLTSVIYLTPGKSNNGTNLYKPIKTGFQPKNYVEKNEYYKSGKMPENYKKYKMELDSNYQKLVSVASEYNSLLAFDGGYHHGTEWDLKPEEERLTLITFFYRINSPWYPIPEMRRRLEINWN